MQVYALSKERDALRRGTDKLSSATDLLKEKDDIIKQVPVKTSAIPNRDNRELDSELLSYISSSDHCKDLNKLKLHDRWC